MLKSGRTKKREIDAGKKIKECLYNIRIKVEEAVAKDICYTEVEKQDVALWKFIDCLVENRVVDEIVQSAKPNTRKENQELPCNHKEKSNREEKPMTDFDCQNKTDDSDDVDHIRKRTSSSRTKRIKISNREINDCLVLFDIKLQEAEHKGVFFTKVRGIEELSWKFLNCLVENKLIDERVLLGQKTKLHKDNDECHFVWNRRSTDPEIRHQQHLDLSDEEDKFKVDVASRSCEETTTYYKCRISLLEKQNITLQKSLLRYEEETNDLKVQRTRYQSLANDYINKFKELQISTEKYTNICFECEKNKQHMMRYRAERDEYKLEKAKLENNMSRERNEILLQQKNNALLTEKNESLKAEIYYIENKLAEEKKRNIDIEYKFKVEISNLKIKITRAGEKFKEVERDNEALHFRYKEQQAILSSERCRFEEYREELRLRLDEKSSKSEDNMWFSAEGSDQNLEKIGKGSIIRAQTMINCDKLFTEKSEEVTKKVSELYENKWKVAMNELGENGEEKKHIEFLLKIFEDAYSFCKHMEERFTEELEQAMLKAAANIKEVVDTALFVRPILERLERCINQMFLRKYCEYQDYRTREHVYTYITESLSLSWFMVTRNPRVSISTTIPNKSHPQYYDTYSTVGSEVDYVVLPMVKWSTNDNEIIRKGIAAFK